MKSNKTYIISDLNLFNEENMKGMGYTNFDAMNIEVVQNWNAVINPEDIVIVLGNVGNGDVNQLSSVIKKLNGILVLLSDESKTRFTSIEWNLIGFFHAWSSPVYKSLNGTMICYTPLKIYDIDKFKSSFDIIVVDHNNPIEGIVHDILFSADALKWKYSPLDIDCIPSIFEDMKEFESLKDSEYRSDIKEEE